MDLVGGVEALRREHGPLFVVVGVFDGLHRGHAYLLRRLGSIARAHGARPAVVTFDAHPDEILTGTAPPLLLDPDERVARLRRAGVAVTVVQHFDRALRETPFEAFVAWITDRVDLRGFLMTPDAAFGYRRGGTPESLAELGRRQGFGVTVVPPFRVDGRSVRSTEIRAAIETGDLAAARRLLGRAHAVVGERAPSGGEADAGAVVRFPMPVAMPPSGTWAVRVGPPLDGATWRGRPDRAGVDDGALRLDAAPRAGRVRVAFDGR